MATCLAVIKRALRMISAVDVGLEPDADQAADSLEALQGLYTHLITSGTLGQFADVIAIISPYVANENERILNGTGAALVVTKPVVVTDFSQPTNQRSPRDLAKIVITGVSPQTWTYDAHLAAWVQIEGLTLTSEAPWSVRLSAGLSALLALHVLSEYRDAVPAPTVAALAGQAMSSLTQRADSVRPVACTDYF
jgi:hypothetical protein